MNGLVSGIMNRLVSGGTMGRIMPGGAMGEIMRGGTMRGRIMGGHIMGGHIMGGITDRRDDRMGSFLQMRRANTVLAARGYECRQGAEQKKDIQDQGTQDQGTRA